MDNIQFMYILLSIETIGNNVGDMFGDILGSDILVGLVVFLFFFILTLFLGLGMLVGSTVLIPALFLVFEFTPDLKIFVAIIIGLLFGMALNKIVRR